MISPRTGKNETFWYCFSNKRKFSFFSVYPIDMHILEKTHLILQKRSMLFKFDKECDVKFTSENHFHYPNKTAWRHYRWSRQRAAFLLSSEPICGEGEGKRGRGQGDAWKTTIDSKHLGFSVYDMFLSQ